MIFSVNTKAREELQAAGFVPAKIADVWIGDTFVWDAPSSDGVDGFGKHRELTVVHLEAMQTWQMDDVEPSVLVTIVSRDKDGLMDTLTVNIDHETWVKQCEDNIALLGSLREYYDRVPA